MCIAMKRENSHFTILGHYAYHTLEPVILIPLSFIGVKNLTFTCPLNKLHFTSYCVPEHSVNN